MKELLGPFGLGLLVFTFIFLIGQVFRLTNLLLNSGVSARLAGELVASLLPNIITLTTPMAILLATLMGVGRLAADREILAMRTSGVNLFSVFFPVLLAAGAVSGGLAWANRDAVPYLNLKSSDLALQVAFQALSSIEPDLPYPLDAGGDQKSTLFYDARETNTGRMLGVRMHTAQQEERSTSTTMRGERLKERIRALQGATGPAEKAELATLRIENERLRTEQGGNEALVTARTGTLSADLENRLIRIELTSGSLLVVNSGDGAASQLVRFSTLVKNVAPDIGQDENGGVKRRPREMPLAELTRTEKSGVRTGRAMTTEYHRRHSLPLACLTFAMIGLPLAVFTRPTGKAVAFALSFGLIFIYYGLLNYGLSLGTSGSPLAPAAIMAPNVLLGGVGAILMARVVRR